MTTNPYESPETVSNPQPSQKSNLPGLLFRWFAAIAILVLLAALLLPNYRGGAGEAARRMQCNNNLKQIGLALQNYHDDYGSFPPAYIADASGKPIHSWRVLILPYMEQKPLYDKYSFDEPWNGPNNSQLHGAAIPAYICPSRRDNSRTDTSCVAVVGAQTAWPGKKAVGMKDITDGTSNTILVVEIAYTGKHWMEPYDLDMDQMPLAVNSKSGPGISSPHPNVALALFADGHTAAITNNTPADIIRRLLTIADGEPIGEY